MVHKHHIPATTLTALYKEISTLNGVILSNPLLPILENFLFEIGKGKIVIAASDQQTSVISHLSLQESTEESCKIAIPARMLRDTLKSLPPQPLSLQIDKSSYNLAVHTNNGRYRIACENADDFPNILTFPSKSPDITLPVEILQQAIKYTLFATSKDELRPELSGVYFTLGPEGLTFVATDGHRLVSYTRKDITTSKECKCIVPAKSLQLLSQLLAGQAEHKVEIIFEEKKLFFSCQHIQCIVSLINESYPDYQNVIPAKNPHNLTLSMSYLAALKRIAIYANRTTQQIRFEIQKNKLKVVAEDLDFSNEAYETIPCQYTGEKMEISFNAKLLTEMLSILASQEEVVFTFDTPNKAVMILPTNLEEEEAVSMLIMPMLLSRGI